MLEGGYGTSDSAPKPGRALYHRLMAAASGDPMARLAMGAATVLGNDAFLSGANAGSAVDSPVRVSRASPAVDSAAPKGAKDPTSRLPNARCALALHYFYHSATTAYEDSAQPGGQARVERGRLHENTRRVKGDLRGESDDRVLRALSRRPTPETRARCWRWETGTTGGTSVCRATTRRRFASTAARTARGRCRARWAWRRWRLRARVRRGTPARRWSTTARRRSGAVRTRSTDSGTSTSTATTPTRRRRTRGPPPTAARRTKGRVRSPRVQDSIRA